MLVLLQRIAATEVPEQKVLERHEEHLVRGPRAVQVSVTGSMGAVRRVGAVLAALELLEPGVPVDGLQAYPTGTPGRVTVHLPAQADYTDDAEDGAGAGAGVRP